MFSGHFHYFTFDDPNDIANPPIRIEGAEYGFGSVDEAYSGALQAAVSTFASRSTPHRLGSLYYSDDVQRLKEYYVDVYHCGLSDGQGNCLNWIWGSLSEGLRVSVSEYDDPAHNPVFAGSCPRPSFATDETGYSWTKKAETKSIDLEGGLPRLRKDFIGANRLITAQWTVRGPMIQFIWNLLQNAKTLPITVELIIDQSSLQSYKAFVVPGTVKISKALGLNQTISCQLEVPAITADATWPNPL